MAKKKAKKQKAAKKKAAKKKRAKKTKRAANAAESQDVVTVANDMGFEDQADEEAYSATEEEINELPEEDEEYF